MSAPTTVESFATRGAAGEVLRVDLERAGDRPVRGLVALVHGFKGFARWGFLPELGRRLAAAGYPTLRPDLSHNGTGEDRGASYERLDLFERDRVSYRREDLAHAIQEARVRHPELGKAPLVLGGHSLGGGLVQLVAEAFGARALFTLAGVSSFDFPEEQARILEREGRLLVPNQRTGDLMPVGRAALDDVRAHAADYDLLARAREGRVPWLIVHGTEDPTVSPKTARDLAAAARGRAELLSIEGADHTFGVRHPEGRPTPAFDAASDAILRFLDRAI